tara:strand:+ start:5216 stop:5773 length:558 start_codon:yes stop_codon:yes gene_type:complete
MTQVNRVDQLRKVQLEGLELFARKNQDYGDAFATYGTIGVLVRLGDKIHRLQSISSRGINLVEDEKLRDTLIDLHNYAGMAIMLMDENDENDETSESLRLKQIIQESGAPLPPPPSPNQLPMPNNLMAGEEIIVSGTNGKQYTLKKYLQDDNSFHMTCTCPSFKYCKLNYKTCKHITNYLAEKNM